MEQSGFLEPFCDEWNSARLVHSVAMKRPPGFRSASSGVRELIRSKVVDIERDPSLVRNREQMQHRVGRAAVIATDAIAFSSPLGDYLARPQITLEQIDRELPGLKRALGFFRIGRRNTVRTHRRDSKNFARGRHCVAVNWPPHAPTPGHATSSSRFKSSRLILPAECAPTASNTS